MVYDIIVDSNEAWQQTYIMEGLKKADFKVKVESLPAGDYYFESDKRGMLVERKTAKDFAASVADGRLWKQIRRMKERRETLGCDIVILVEGTWYQVVKHSKWSRSSIIGVIDSVRDPDGWDVEIFGPVPSKTWTLLWFKRRINKNKNVTKKTLHALRQKIPDRSTLSEKQRYILEGLPGFGPHTADKALRKYGSVINVMKNIKKIHELSNVGPKTREKAVKIVNGRYKNKS